MKIGIVTVYNSYNCGSFLQAYALYRTLCKEGHDVAFLRRKIYKTNKLSYRVFMAAKRIYRKNIRRALFIMKEYFIFNKNQKCLPKIETLDGRDLVIYGSDTIWNMEEPYLKENWERYWGVGVKEKKITYAASVGPTKEEIFFENSQYGKYINEFADVLVRDKKTYEISEKLLDDGKSPKMVVDPTMLLNNEEYDDIIGECKENGFILFYAFEKITDKQKKDIEAFAKEKGKKIIVFGEDIPFEPKTMLAYYKAADYVVTNTFHGNVFSIIYNKKFVSFGKEKSKVKALLEEFGLGDRLLGVNELASSVMDKEIDYTKVNEILEQKRADSLEKLNKHTK